MSAMISGVGRGSALPVVSGGRARGKTLATSLAASLAVSFDRSLGAAWIAATVSLNIGAGCGPACSSKPFTTIATTASTTTMNPTASRRLQPKRGSAAKRGASASSSLRRFDLGTDLHPMVRGTLGGMRRCACSPLLDRSKLGRPACTFAVDRQADRNARALTDPAHDLDLTAMQRHQPLNDREPQSGSIVATVVGRARLEERIADARHVLGVDPDAGIRNRHCKRSALMPGADRDLAAAIGELDGVGNEIEHDLIERALVGDDVRQLARQDRDQLNS